MMVCYYWSSLEVCWTRSRFYAASSSTSPSLSAQLFGMITTLSKHQKPTVSFTIQWHKDGFMNKSISPSSVPVRWGGIMSQNSSFKRISQCCADNNESLAALQTSFTLLLETYRTFVDTQKQSYFRNRVTWPPPDANSLWIRPRPCPPFFMTHIQSFSPALYYCRLFILRYKAL